MTRTTSLKSSFTTLISSASGLGERLTSYLRYMPLVFKPAIPDAFRVACFAETVARQPIVRHWLLVIASESPRLRRALLARAARALRSELGGIEAAEALEQLRDIALVRAVIDTLFFEQGIPSLAPDQCTGRSARVRFSELAQKLQIREATLLVV